MTLVPVLIKLADNSRFSVLGPNWSMRLNPFDKVPQAYLTLDGQIDNRPVRFFCQLDGHNTLCFDGEWEWILN